MFVECANFDDDFDNNDSFYLGKVVSFLRLWSLFFEAHYSFLHQLVLPVPVPVPVQRWLLGAVLKTFNSFIQ